MISASAGVSENTLLPQFGQNERPRYVATFESELNALRGQTANVLKTEPLVCRQSVQWQIPTRSGSPSTWYRTSPHWQPPARTD
jgi:hypothetical protein